LSEPKDRLAHLILLEAGSKPDDIRKIAAATMDLYLEIGRVCREVDLFLTQKSKAGSPLRKAELFRQGLEWIDRMQPVQKTLSSRYESLKAELKTLNQAWATERGQRGTGKPDVLGRLEEIYRELSYLHRWASQVEQRLVQLSF
jgi:hypothetical protein